jgi:hypothetical protein
MPEHIIMQDTKLFRLQLFLAIPPSTIHVGVVVVVVGRSWQATNVPQPVGLLYRRLLNVPHSSGGSWNYYERE